MIMIIINQNNFYELFIKGSKCSIELVDQTQYRAFSEKQVNNLPMAKDYLLKPLQKLFIKEKS